VEHTHYVLGSVVGPHPFPMMVRDFQCVIGREARQQVLGKEGRLPDYLVACVGGGSNSIGLFYPFLADSSVKMVGVEAGGTGNAIGQHAATLIHGSPGVLHGSKSYVLQDKDGQTCRVHSVAPGLDYPGVGPEHSMLVDEGRVRYFSVSDEETLEAFQLCARCEGIVPALESLEAFQLCARCEGIVPALESAHAVAYLMREDCEIERDALVILCMSGRGDKDVYEVAHHLGLQ